MKTKHHPRILALFIISKQVEHILINLKKIIKWDTWGYLFYNKVLINKSWSKDHLYHQFKYAGKEINIVLNPCCMIERKRE